MRIWSIIKILAFFVLLIIVTALTTMNADLLKSDFLVLKGASLGNYSAKDFKLPVFIVLVGAFVAGLMVSVVFIGIQEIELLLENFRSKGKRKKADAIEGLYSYGVEAHFDGRMDEAVATFYKILEQEPKHLQTRLKLGQVLRKLGRYDEAIKIHKEALDDAQDNHRILYDLATDYKENKDLDKAKKILLKITEDRPRTSINAHRCLRDIHIENNDWEQAIEVQDKILKFAKSTKYEGSEKEILVSILYRQGLHACKNGDLKSSIKMFRRVIKQDPLFIPAYLELGQAYLEDEQPDEAVKIWKEGLSVTKSPIFLTRIEKHYLDAELPMIAIETFQDIISKTDSVVIPRFLLGKLYLRLEMIDEAERQFKEISSRVKYSPTLNYFIGKILERKGQFKTASEKYRDVIKNMHILNLQYICRKCGSFYPDWKDSCEKCGSWNSIEIDLTEEGAHKDFGSPEMLSTP